MIAHRRVLWLLAVMVVIVTGSTVTGDGFLISNAAADSAPPLKRIALSFDDAPRRPREKRDAVRVALQDRGLTNGYVTVDNYDWYLDSKWQKAIAEGRPVDVDALRDVYVEMLLGAVRFYDDIATRWLEGSPTHVLLLHENDVAALAIEAGLDPRTLTHLAIEEAEIDALLDERHVFGAAE